MVSISNVNYRKSCIGCKVYEAGFYIQMYALISVVYKMLFTAVSSVPLFYLTMLTVLQHNLIADCIILYDPINTIQFYWKLINDNMNINYGPAEIQSGNLFPVNTNA